MLWAPEIPCQAYCQLALCYNFHWNHFPSHPHSHFVHFVQRGNDCSLRSYRITVRFIQRSILSSKTIFLTNFLMTVFSINCLFVLVLSTSHAIFETTINIFHL